MRIKRILIIPSGTLIERLRTIVSCNVLATYLSIPWYMHWEKNNDCTQQINDIVDNKYIDLPQDFINITNYYFNPNQDIISIINNLDNLGKDSLIISTSHEFKHPNMSTEMYLKLKRKYWNNFKFNKNILDAVDNLYQQLFDQKIISSKDKPELYGVEMGSNSSPVENHLNQLFVHNNNQKLLCTNNSVFSQNFLDKNKECIIVIPKVNEDKTIQELFNFLVLSHTERIYGNGISVISDETVFLKNAIKIAPINNTIPIGAIANNSVYLIGIQKLTNVIKKDDENCSIKIENDFLKDNNITIIGCARNCQNYLYNFKETILEIKDKFKSVNIVIVENDSEDETKNLLYLMQKELEITNNNITFSIIHPTIPGNIRARTEKMAFIRNYCLNYYFDNFKVRGSYTNYDSLKTVMDFSEKGNNIITGNPNIKDNDYLLLWDIDSKLEANSLLECFNKDISRWDMLGANQYPERYYDVWALRSCENKYNCWGVELSDFDRILYINERQKVIHPNNDLISVESCFGGAALYKATTLEKVRFCKAWYDSYDGSDCEHVSFHKLLIEKAGAKININPGLITHQPNMEHYILK